MAKGYIYIMTNPSYKSVKIGYTTNLEDRRIYLSKQTGVPDEFELYAAYATYKNAADRTLHAMIDKLNPKLRHTMDREFYDMSPEDAYDILERIALISGTMNRLKRVNANRNNVRRHPRKIWTLWFSKRTQTI